MLALAADLERFKDWLPQPGQKVATINMAECVAVVYCSQTLFTGRFDWSALLLKSTTCALVQLGTV